MVMCGQSSVDCEGELPSKDWGYSSRVTRVPRKSHGYIG